MKYLLRYRSKLRPVRTDPWFKNSIYFWMFKMGNAWLIIYGILKKD